MPRRNTLAIVLRCLSRIKISCLLDVYIKTFCDAWYLYIAKVLFENLGKNLSCIRQIYMEILIGEIYWPFFAVVKLSCADTFKQRLFAECNIFVFMLRYHGKIDRFRSTWGISEVIRLSLISCLTNCEKCRCYLLIQSLLLNVGRSLIMHLLVLLLWKWAHYFHSRRDFTLVNLWWHVWIRRISRYMDSLLTMRSSGYL